MALLFTALLPPSYGYQLVHDYNSPSFFNNFNFFTGPDPTNGYVDYLSREDASGRSLIGHKLYRKGFNDKHEIRKTAIISVDHTNTTCPQGRPSVRLEGKYSYNGGLLVADILHMPGGICGTWPALWVTGDNWPYDGEIDVVEGVNNQDVNLMTLHTSAGCIVDSNTPGLLNTPNCDANAPDQPKNVGCQLKPLLRAQGSYGSKFNAQRGGVYAMEWASEYIQIWFFPRGAIPPNVESARPDPATWGPPMARFAGGGCDFVGRFKNLRIIINTALCGDWAGSTWEESDCPTKTGAATCIDYVRDYPEAFTEAYWEFAGLKWFEKLNGTANINGTARRSVRSGLQRMPSPTLDTVEARFARKLNSTISNALMEPTTPPLTGTVNNKLTLGKTP